LKRKSNSLLETGINFPVFHFWGFSKNKFFAMADQENELEKIESRLNSLEIRLARLEAALTQPEKGHFYGSEESIQTSEANLIPDTLNEEEKDLESKIGRFGLAWLGNIVLLFGITFLAQYLMIKGQLFLSVIIGYIAAASIFLLSNYLKKSNDHLSFMFKLNALVLLYYITLRLHYFSTSPILQGKTISVILLLLIVCFQVYISIRDKSQVFAALSVVFALITAIVGDSTHFMLPLVVLTAAGAVYYCNRFNWQPLLILTIIVTYTSFFLWMVGNPVMGHPMKLITVQHSGVIYFFGLGACYSILLLFRKREASSDEFFIGATFINGILFTILLIFIVLGFFSKNYVALFSIITIFCLGYSTILHARSDWNFGSAYYALYGFMAMSIALYGLFGFPKVYLLLALQSLVVVSMALWFRNKLIVVMNSLLFLTILIVYLLSSKSINGVNYSFALVPLISARIINWKKSRLHIETDLMRNLYLIEGFVMVLYALFHAVPKQFITLSWTIAALLYFLLSFILKNVKYRYMALGTMISASFYLFLVDLAKIEIIYRVLALLFLAAISIGISIYYTNRIKKSDK
jgi:hypothetical protein